MSGMTRSMPNISSSGNISPQSMTTISSPYSNTYMFLPISPTPPSGMIRSGSSLAVGTRSVAIVRRASAAGRRRRSVPAASSARRWRARRRCRPLPPASVPRPRRRRRRRVPPWRSRPPARLRRRPPGRGGAVASRRAGVDQGRRDGRDVGVALALDGGRPQRGGRVVHREGERVERRRFRVDRSDGAVRLRDPRAGHERGHRVAAERHDDGRIEHWPAGGAGTARRPRSRPAAGRGCRAGGT